MWHPFDLDYRAVTMTARRHGSSPSGAEQACIRQAVTQAALVYVDRDGCEACSALVTKLGLQRRGCSAVRALDLPGAARTTDGGHLKRIAAGEIDRWSSLYGAWFHRTPE